MLTTQRKRKDNKMNIRQDTAKHYRNIRKLLRADNGLTEYEQAHWHNVKVMFYLCVSIISVGVVYMLIK